MSDPREATPLSFTQTGTNGGFVGISFKTWFLNIITLTLYRFWGRTEVRKKIWRETQLNGESFEYTGTGFELFKGFLIATFVVVLPYLLVVFVGQLLPPAIGIPLIIAFVLVLYWGIGAAVWLAFRYLASRTTWRGIRFELKGEAIPYTNLYFGQLLLTIVTLGFWSPKMDLRVSAPMWENMNYGDIPFSFDMEEAKRENLYGPFLIAWLSGLVAYAGIVGFAVASGFSGALDPTDPGSMTNFILAIYGAAFVLVLILLFTWAPYQAAILRGVVRGIKVGDATFKMEINWLTMAWLSFSSMLLVLFSLGIASPLVAGRSARYLISRLKSEGTVDLSAANQTVRGPNQAEGLSDALDIGLV
jgi:uncharacterized membrane protein YjgN (DUF898 family)